MAGVTLSSAVRTNLLSLQNISAGQSSVQNRLATGKKVNSALDNATSFFTASSFQSRANSLSSLLDSVATGVQTLQAANNGITSITSLVSQLRSTAQQALQSTSAYSAQAKITTSSAVTGSTAADLRGTGVASAAVGTATNALASLTSGTRAATTSTATFSSQMHGASQARAVSTADFSTLTNTQAAKIIGTATSLSGLTDDNASAGSGSSLTIGDGAASSTLVYDTTATSADTTKFASLADLNTKLATLNIKAQVASDAANGNKITVTATDTSVATVSSSGSAATTLGLGATGSRVDGSKIRINDGTTARTFYYDSTGLRADSFTNATTLSAKLSTNGVNATAAMSGTKLAITGTNNANLTIDNGTSSTAVLGFTATANAYTYTAASTLMIGDGTTTQTFTFNATAAAGDTTQFNSIGDLNTKLTSAGIKVSASNDSGNLKLVSKDYSSTLTVGGNARAGLGLAASTNSIAGSVLSMQDGATTKTYTYDTAAGIGDASSFSSISDLNTKMTNDGVKARATDPGSDGKLRLTATDTTSTLTVSGTAQTGLGLRSSIAPTTGPGALDGKTLSFTTSGGKGSTVTFGDPATTPGSIKSLDDLNAKLADAGLSASLDSTGNLSFSTTAQTASQTFTISGSAVTDSGKFGTTASSTAVRGGSGADNRDSLVTQFNNLLTQIDTAAKDANFNGLNLLNGDTLSLIFNETNTSKLDVNGTSASSIGLGLSTIGASNFNDGTGINDVLTKIDKAKNSLASQASKFGSNLAVVQTRQDFTKSMINTLNVGADNLVNADMNEEATNLLSLNTSQSLAQQALSLANQSQQSVLQLIR